MRKEMERMSLNDVEKAYRLGGVNREEVIEYLRAWNQGPVFTQAFLRDDIMGIINMDPERIPAYLAGSADECGVRGRKRPDLLAERDLPLKGEER